MLTGDERMAFIRQKVEEGESFGSIARSLGISRQRVGCLCKQAGVDSAHPKGGKPSQEVDAKYADTYERWVATHGGPRRAGGEVRGDGFYSWVRRRGLPTPKHTRPDHGTISRYTYHGCRCDACRDTATATARDWTERRTGRKVVPRGPYRRFRERGGNGGSPC